MVRSLLKGTPMTPTAPALHSIGMTLLRNVISQMIGPRDSYDAQIIADIAMRLADSEIPAASAEIILYDTLYLAARDGHTALPKDGKAVYRMAAMLNDVELALYRR